jgi:hypothetical protein
MLRISGAQLHRDCYRLNDRRGDRAAPALIASCDSAMKREEPASRGNRKSPAIAFTS